MIDTGSKASEPWIALLAVFLVVSLPVSAKGNPPIVPTISITIAPPTQQVRSSPEETTLVHFTGKVTVGLARGQTAHATLTGSVDAGWPATINPSQMTFPTPGTQDFTCDVSVPPGTSNMTGTLTINGRVVAAGLQAVDQVTALITVGSAVQNITKSAGSAQAAGGGLGGAAILAAIAMIAAVAVAGIILVRRRRRMRADGGGVPATEE